MRILIVEDDFVSSKLLQTILFPYGICDVADNGYEGLELFRKAVKEEEPYDLICLDIMMPEMDGQQMLKEIRGFEEIRGITGMDGVKIIMVTALDDFENISRAFREQCEAYYIKPIDKDRLLETLKKLNLIQDI